MSEQPQLLGAGVANLVGGATGAISFGDMIGNIADINARNAEIKANNARLNQELLKIKLMQRQQALSEDKFGFQQEKFDKEYGLAEEQLTLDKSRESRLQAEEARTAETYEYAKSQRPIAEAAVKAETEGTKARTRLQTAQAKALEQENSFFGHLEKVIKAVPDAYKKMSEQFWKNRKSSAEYQKQLLQLETLNAYKEAGDIENYTRLLFESKLTKPDNRKYAEVHPLLQKITFEGKKKWGDLSIPERAIVNSVYENKDSNTSDITKDIIDEFLALEHQNIKNLVKTGGTDLNPIVSFEEEAAKKIYEDMTTTIANRGFEAVQYLASTGELDYIISKMTEDLGTIYPKEKSISQTIVDIYAKLGYIKVIGHKGKKKLEVRSDREQKKKLESQKAISETVTGPTERLFPKKKKTWGGAGGSW